MTRTPRQGFGLAFDIERTPDTKSGFRPAKYDMGGVQELFGDVRIDGFAAALRLGIFEKITIVGGDEGRYKNDNPINRAFAIREMLIHDHGIAPSLVDAVPSKSNTLGNVGIIKDRSTSDDDVVVSNLYHLPRAAMDIASAGLRLGMMAAEAYVLLEDPKAKQHIIKALGGGPLAMRYAEEVQGMADKLRGTYQSRTDVTPITCPAAPQSQPAKV